MKLKLFQRMQRTSDKTLADRVCSCKVLTGEDGRMAELSVSLGTGGRPSHSLRGAIADWRVLIKKLAVEAQFQAAKDAGLMRPGVVREDMILFQQIEAAKFLRALAIEVAAGNVNL